MTSHLLFWLDGRSVKLHNYLIHNLECKINVLLILIWVTLYPLKQKPNFYGFCRHTTWVKGWYGKQNFTEGSCRKANLYEGDLALWTMFLWNCVLKYKTAPQEKQQYRTCLYIKKKRKTEQGRGYRSMFLVYFRRCVCLGKSLNTKWPINC